MARQRLQTILKWTIIALLLILIAMTSAQKERPVAYAGSSRFDLTFDETTFRYTKEGETVERRVYVDESLYTDLIRITYNVVSTETSDVMRGQIKTSNGVAVNEGVVWERKNVVVAKESLQTWTTGKKAYCFTVSADHCCAFIFTVYYDKGEGEEDEAYYDSPILYLTTVDNVAPKVTIDDYNVFMNTVTVKFDDSSDNCASSGTKSYTVYQDNTQTGERKTYLTSDKITSKKATITLESGKYNYYVSAKDAVGNESEEVLVARYDVDELIRSADNAVMTIESAPDDWSETFKDRLNKAYGEYVVVANAEPGTVSDEEKEEKEEALTAVLDEYRRFVGYKINGKENVSLKIIGKDYFKEGPTVLNMSEGCAFIKYGEDGAVTLSVEKHSYSSEKADILSASQGEGADDLYLITVQTVTTEKMDCREDFSTPLKVSLSVGEYLSVSAVQVVEENGNVVYVPCPVTEYTNGTLVLNVSKTYGTVYLFVREGEKKTYWLYLLFLLLPVSVGVASIIILKKKKGVKNNVRKEADHQ